MDGPDPGLVRLRVLGGFDLQPGRGQVVIPAGRKVRALLACLGLSRGKAWPRERLMALLWSDRGEEQARASLRQALAEMRRVLGEPSPVRTEHDAVSLDPDLIAVDALEFERLAKAGKWDEAAALYGGPLLDGHGVHDGAFEDWILVERTRLHDLAVDVLERLAAAQSGDAAIATAQRLLQLEPGREATHRLLMRVYAAAGQRAQALRQYEHCREVLQRDLQARPDAETERLYREIQSEAPPPPPAADAAPSPPPPLPDRPSIAVLPFVNMSGDPEQEYFSDGITEDIITELSRSPSLFVIARNSSFTFKGQAVDIVEVGRKLGVEYVIEGSVRKVGTRVRISAQLIEAESGRHVWADRFDRQLEDVFAVQDEVVEMVASRLGRSLRDMAFNRARARPVNSLSAYESLLRGRAAWWDGDTEGAFAHVERALAADPNYAAAHAWLALQYTYDQFKYQLNMTIEERARRAREHAEAALRLDDRDAFVQMAVSMVYCFTDGGDRVRALRHSDVAIALNPHDFECMYCRAYVLAWNGKRQEALGWLDKARRQSPITSYHLAEAYFDVHEAMADYEMALKEISGQGRLPVNMYLHIALANVHLDRKGEARRWIEKFECERPDHFDVCSYLRFIVSVFSQGTTYQDVVDHLREVGLHVPD
ncbi:MAG: BTAD domain-containing putative transcriptional regulator [Dongiaceae bacterium]